MTKFEKMDKATSQQTHGLKLKRFQHFFVVEFLFFSLLKLNNLQLKIGYLLLHRINIVYHVLHSFVLSWRRLFALSFFERFGLVGCFLRARLVLYGTFSWL